MRTCQQEIEIGLTLGCSSLLLILPLSILFFRNYESSIPEGQQEFVIKRR